LTLFNINVIIVVREDGEVMKYKVNGLIYDSYMMAMSHAFAVLCDHCEHMAKGWRILLADPDLKYDYGFILSLTGDYEAALSVVASAIGQPVEFTNRFYGEPMEFANRKVVRWSLSPVEHCDVVGVLERLVRECQCWKDRGIYPYNDYKFGRTLVLYDVDSHPCSLSYIVEDREFDCYDDAIKYEKRMKHCSYELSRVSLVQVVDADRKELRRIFVMSGNMRKLTAVANHLFGTQYVVDSSLGLHVNYELFAGTVKIDKLESMYPESKRRRGIFMIPECNSIIVDDVSPERECPEDDSMVVLFQGGRWSDYVTK